MLASLAQTGLAFRSAHLNSHAHCTCGPRARHVAPKWHLRSAHEPTRVRVKATAKRVRLRLYTEVLTVCASVGREDCGVGTDVALHALNAGFADAATAHLLAVVAH